jgi:hypothetical protein
MREKISEQPKPIVVLGRKSQIPRLRSNRWSDALLENFHLKNITLEKILSMIVLRMPVNIRPLFEIHPYASSKDLGYMAREYLNRYKPSKELHFNEYVESCVAWFEKWLDRRSTT